MKGDDAVGSTHDVGAEIRDHAVRYRKICALVLSGNDQATRLMPSIFWRSKRRANSR